MNDLLNYYCVQIPMIFIFIIMYYRYRKYDFKKLNRKTNKKESFVIRYSESYGHIVLLCTASYLVLFTIIQLLSPEPFFNNADIDWMFPFFGYMGILIFYGTSMKKVVVKKDFVTVYRLLENHTILHLEILYM